MISIAHKFHPSKSIERLAKTKRSLSNFPSNRSNFVLHTKMKFLVPALLAISSASAFTSTQPMPRIGVTHLKPVGKRSSDSGSALYISTGDDRSERQSLDISKTTYVSLVKAPKDSYMAFAEKGKSNGKHER